MENHGADYKNRWAVVREKVLAMREIWNNAEAEFHGEYVDFDPIWSYPKPVQDNGPPIWIGANSKWVFDRIADYGDGWMPIGGLGSGNMELLRAPSRPVAAISRVSTWRCSAHPPTPAKSGGASPRDSTR